MMQIPEQIGLTKEKLAEVEAYIAKREKGIQQGFDNNSRANLAERLDLIEKYLKEYVDFHIELIMENPKEAPIMELGNHYVNYLHTTRAQLESGNMTPDEVKEDLAYSRRLLNALQTLILNIKPVADIDSLIEEVGEELEPTTFEIKATEPIGQPFAHDKFTFEDFKLPVELEDAPIHPIESRAHFSDSPHLAPDDGVTCDMYESVVGFCPDGSFDVLSDEAIIELDYEEKVFDFKLEEIRSAIEKVLDKDVESLNAILLELFEHASKRDLDEVTKQMLSDDNGWCSSIWLDRTASSGFMKPLHFDFSIRRYTKYGEESSMSKQMELNLRISLGMAGVASTSWWTDNLEDLKDPQEMFKAFNDIVPTYRDNVVSQFIGECMHKRSFDSFTYLLDQDAMQRIEDFKLKTRDSYDAWYKALAEEYDGYQEEYDNLQEFISNLK